MIKGVDVFLLQNTVAKKIAEAIKAKVTPAELQQINKKPTENILAYDYYLKGLENQNEQSEAGLNKAILNFEKAIEEDSKYANAHAQIAICYYYLDVNKIEKKYLDKLNEYAVWDEYEYCNAQIWTPWDTELVFLRALI